MGILQVRMLEWTAMLAAHCSGLQCTRLNVADLGLIPGLGRSPGEGSAYPLQYSCLKTAAKMMVPSSLTLAPSVQFSYTVVSVCDPMDCSTSGFPVHHQLPELAQAHVHWVGDAMQPSHPVIPFSFVNLSQHQSLFQWVSSSHQVAKVLEFQLQYKSFQWIFRTDSL